MIPNWPSLRDWRTSRGMTVQMLADKLECSAVHVSRVERGLETLTPREVAIVSGRAIPKESERI